MLFLQIEKILALTTDTIICVSKFEYEAAVRGGLPEHKMKVVYNGVEDGIYSGDRPHQNNSPIRVLWVGRLDYQKGFDLFVEAINKIGREDIEVTVIGDYVYEEFDEGDLSKINMLGWLGRDDVRSWYSKSDVLVMASRWEGFAMTPLEAMSFGLPVISSNCTSCPEMIVDGETGFLFENESVDSLVRLIENLDINKLTSMRPKALAHFQNNFTQIEMIEKTLSLY